MQRTILAYTLKSTPSNELLGYIKPLAEIADNKLIGLNEENFCPTMTVFITTHYIDLERKFHDGKFFEITVSESIESSDGGKCKYVAKEENAKTIAPKSYFEIIIGELPNANERIISLNNLPGTNYIFINNGRAVYGPLAWDKVVDDGICLKLITTPLPGFSVEPGQIYEINLSRANQHAVVAQHSDGDRYIVSGLSIIENAILYDYASDSEIVSYCAKQANQITGVKKAAETLKELAGALRASQIPLVNNRLEKLTEIASSATEYQNEVVKGVSSYLQSDDGKKTIEAYLEKYEPSILIEFKKKHQDALDSELTDKNKKIKEADDRIKELNESKAKLSDEVQELIKNRENEAQKPIKSDVKQVKKQEVYSAEIAAYLHEDINKLREDKQKLEQEIDSNKNLVDGLVEIQNITNKINYLKERNREEDLAHGKLQQTLRETDDNLRTRLTELRPFIEAINGSFIPEDDETRNIYIPTNSKSNDIGQRDVIKAIQQVFVSQRREIDDWQVANLLICTQQSFITFLAGLPGVGKTSLARLLAETQNIKPRIQEISVARGWTSQKELIGFFNPLNSRFQASNTGFYSFLKALTGEMDDQSTAMSYALLDEANLSPIEHYWSAFMKATDGEDEKELTLGRDKIKIPAHLRFIATINYDGTTEPLSDRVVDRAPIIVLESKELPKESANPTNQVDDSGLILPISALKMNELFGNDSTLPIFEYAEQSIFDSIRKILSDTDPTLGRPINISPRKVIAIRQFCGKARGIMNEDSDFFALDVAVLQHILPLIRGNGTPFSKRLEILKKELEDSGLYESAKYLSRMIEYGKEDLRTYDFFCW